MADDVETPEPLSIEARTMAAVDAALEPVFKAFSSPQPAHSSHLLMVARTFRQALALVVHGVPETADGGGESLDMLNVQRRAHQTASQDQAAPVFAEDPTVDPEKPAPAGSKYDKAKAAALAKA